MAITKVRRTEDWSGTLNEAGRADYSVAFLVETDSEDHGVQDIADANDGTDRVPKIGTAYRFGTDYDASAVAATYTVKRIDKFLWHVQVKYKFVEGPKMEEQGQPTIDWRLEGPTIEVRPIQVSRPGEFGAYIGYSALQSAPGGQPLFIGPAKVPLGPRQWQPQNFAEPGGPSVAGGIKNAIPLCNSADQQFDPPPEAEYSRLAVTITRNHYRFPTILMGLYQDTVNKDWFLININGFFLRVPPFTAKMQSISGSREYSDDSPFWRVRYEFHLDLYKGWRVDLLDRGYVETKEDDEKSELESPGNEDNYPTATNTQLQVVIDDKGIPMNEPVLLEHGKAITSDSTPNYIRYAIYQERPFAPLLFDRPGPILAMPE